MFVRLAAEPDFDRIIDLARASAAESVGYLPFDEAKARATLMGYLDTAEPTIFVVEHEQIVIGFLLATIRSFWAASGLSTVQEVIFVQPDKRGTRAAALLIKHFLAWSESLGAQEVNGGNDNSFHSERTARFLQRFGFEHVGYYMRKRLAHG